MAIRSAPALYEQRDQQDVRNEIQRLVKDADKPARQILVSDVTTGALYYIQVNSGTLEAVAV